MKVVGVEAVEAARGGRLVLEPRTVVTPLARDRAAELGVVLVEAAAPSSSPSRRSGRVDLRPRTTHDPGPPSGALFRRGGPVRAGVAAPGVRTVDPGGAG